MTPRPHPVAPGGWTPSPRRPASRCWRALAKAEDYSWAIVGEQSGRYLWLLSRQPNPANRDELIARAGALGYDTSMLRITRQL
jgi:lipocalin